MKKNTKMILIFVGGAILFWLIGVLFFVIQVHMKKSLEETKEICTDFTYATVIEMEKTYETEFDDYYYYPTYEYFVDDVRYEIETGNGSNRRMFDEGEEVELYYNPDNPEEVYIPGEQQEIELIIFNVIGVVCIIGGFIVLGVMFGVVRSKREE